MKVALVLWHDAHAGNDGNWIHLDDCKDDEPYLVATAGIILDPKRGGKKNHVSVASSLTNDGHVDYITHIPKRMVVCKYELYELGDRDAEEWDNKERRSLVYRVPEEGGTSWRRRRKSPDHPDR
ncbi:MAG: hypothetical protein ACO3VQ_06290 [Ilumatobacteraceae bacterium]